MVIDILSTLFSPYPSDVIISLLVVLQQRTYPDHSFLTFSPIFSIMNFFSKLAFFGLVALLLTDSGVSARLLGSFAKDCMKDCIAGNKEGDGLNAADRCHSLEESECLEYFRKDFNDCMKLWKEIYEEEATNGIGGFCKLVCSDD
jgi:hypothetical protein